VPPGPIEASVVTSMMGLQIGLGFAPSAGWALGNRLRAATIGILTRVQPQNCHHKHPHWTKIQIICKFPPGHNRLFSTVFEVDTKTLDTGRIPYYIPI